MKRYEIWPRPKGFVQKIFQALAANFIKGPYKSWLKFMNDHNKLEFINYGRKKFYNIGP